MVRCLVILRFVYSLGRKCLVPKWTLRFSSSALGLLCCNFCRTLQSVRFYVYIVCPSAWSLNNPKLNKTYQGKHLYAREMNVPVNFSTCFSVGTTRPQATRLRIRWWHPSRATLARKFFFPGFARSLKKDRLIIESGLDMSKITLTFPSPWPFRPCLQMKRKKMTYDERSETDFLWGKTI